MFARRGFNIDSLTVGETEHSELSRITVTMTGEEHTLNQIVKQLGKLHDVKKLEVLEDKNTVVRELLLIKVAVKPETRQEIMDAVNVFRCKIIDFAPESLCVEITGESSKIDAFVDYMKPFTIIEMCRTGVVALSRGSKTLKLK
jgi:acetolactate synthase, small subunit